MIIVIAIVVVCVIMMLRKKKEGFDAHSPVGTLYYTNWCGYSNKMLGSLLKHNIKNNIVKVGKYNLELVECSENKDQCKKENISGFPTTILKNGQQIVGYTPDMVKAVEEGLKKPKAEKKEEVKPAVESTQAPVQDVKTPAPTKEGFDAHEGVVGKIYYTNWCGYSNKLLGNLLKFNIKNNIAKTKKHSLRLVECSKNKACEGKGIDGFPTIILKNNQKVVGYTPKLDEAIDAALKKKAEAPKKEQPKREQPRREQPKREQPKKSEGFLDNFFDTLSADFKGSN